MLKSAKAIIFDMDNTLIQSRIDFVKMKIRVGEIFKKYKLISDKENVNNYTVTTLFERAKQHGNISKEIEKEAWQSIAEVEDEGMQNINLEPYAKELLDGLSRTHILNVMTNNREQAAENVLRKLGVDQYFEHIIGRETAGALKPSPAGYAWIMNQYPELSHEHWIAIGDSWMDGAAAQQVDIPFIAYQADQTLLQSKQINPVRWIEHLKELVD